MNERISDKEIINKFVNSYEFPIIENYISKPYEETIIELDEEIKEKDKEIERLNNIIDKAIHHINEYCIDDEFYINLSNKEKGIFEVLNILKEGK